MLIHLRLEVPQAAVLAQSPGRDSTGPEVTTLAVLCCTGQFLAFIGNGFDYIW